jgi:hypothetical protein
MGAKADNTQKTRKVIGVPFQKGNKAACVQKGKPKAVTLRRMAIEEMLLQAVELHGGVKFFHKKLKPKDLVPMLARMVKDRKDDSPKVIRIEIGEATKPKESAAG